MAATGSREGIGENQSDTTPPLAGKACRWEIVAKERSLKGDSWGEGFRWGAKEDSQTTKQVVAAQCHCVALYCHLFKRLRDSATMLSHLARSLSHETQTIALFYNLNSDIINISLFRCCYSTNLFLCTNHTLYLLASFIQGAHRQPHLLHPLALVPHLVLDLILFVIGTIL